MFKDKKKLGVFQSGQMGQTVNLLSFDFGGSNPSAPTSVETLQNRLTAEECKIAEIAQPSKLGVAGLSPVFRSNSL